jgi:hypothetical protein
LARIAFRDSSREGVLLLLESGRALAAIEWRARLSANRYPPRIKVREKAFAEHALTGRMHRNDESISGSQTQAIIAGAPAVIAAASKRHVVRRGDRPFAPMIPVGLLRMARPDSDFSATLRHNFFALTPESSTAALRIVKSSVL